MLIPISKGDCNVLTWRPHVVEIDGLYSCFLINKDVSAITSHSAHTSVMTSPFFSSMLSEHIYNITCTQHNLCYSSDLEQSLYYSWHLLGNLIGLPNLDNLSLFSLWHWLVLTGEFLIKGSPKSSGAHILCHHIGKTGISKSEDWC